MEAVTKCILFSLMMAISCRIFFDTLLPRRHFRHPWVGRTVIPAFLAGFLVIAVTPIPPYIFQPVRVILITFLVVKIYYQAGSFKSFIACVLFCGIYWVISLLTVSALICFPSPRSGKLMRYAEDITNCLYLGLMLLFSFQCKKKFFDLADNSWTRFCLFPLPVLIFSVSFAMTSWDGSLSDSRAKLAAIVSFTVINGSIFYFILDLIKKEKEMHELRLIHERTLSQMNQYRSVRNIFEQQRKHLHDYKNQLNYIQGMLKDGRDEEAIAYISELTGSIRKSTESVNIGHTAVNVVLNQKYQEACEKKIAMSIAVNNLSSFSMPEEQIVSLLGNLLDNAIEACERLNPDLAKVIYFKMILEDRQLILSTRNPVITPPEIKNNRIRTQKPDADRHGLGLLNIDAIIRENHGTSVLKCEDGWFYFSAVIPAATDS